MKEIILIRHAKSSWEYDVDDMERPLKKRGYTDIQLVSERFREYGFQPDAIFSSPAMRARLTADLFIKATSNAQVDFKIIDQLYDFSGPTVVEFIKALSNKYDKVIIFGHNHAFTSISNIFGHLPIDNVPTSGLVHLKFKISNWQNLKKGKTKLMLFPRDLKK
jgi:phosphohistidine phosphatase